MTSTKGILEIQLKYLFRFILVLTFCFLFIMISGCSKPRGLDAASIKVNNKTYALIIGVGQYKTADYHTQYASNDASGIANELSTIYGKNAIKLLQNSEATKTQIQDGIQNWLGLQAEVNSTAIIYFAGSGTMDNLLLPYDTVQGSDNSDINPQEFETWVSSVKSKNVVIILDSCFSGNFAEAIEHNGSTSIVITGGSDGELCWQSDAFKHGVFSYYLIDALNNIQNVDKNNDGIITINELFTYISDKIQEDYVKAPPPSPQHPEIINPAGNDLELFQITKKSVKDFQFSIKATICDERDGFKMVISKLS